MYIMQFYARILHKYKNIMYLQRLNHNDYFKAITLKAKLKNGINYSINSIIKLE